MLVTLGMAAAVVQAASESFDDGVVTTSSSVGVELAGDGAPLMSLTNAKPGDRVEACLAVTARGGTGRVVSYGATRGSGLDRYLNLTVTRGQLGVVDNYSCDGFVSDSENYLGHGNGVIYSGSLADYADSQTTGIRDPIDGDSSLWAENETHVYRFGMQLSESGLAQGLDAEQDFIFCVQQPNESSCGKRVEESPIDPEPEQESSCNSMEYQVAGVTTTGSWSVRQTKSSGRRVVVMRARFVGPSGRQQIRLSTFVKRSRLWYVPLRQIRSVRYTLNGKQLGNRYKRPFAWHLDPAQVVVGKNRFVVRVRLKNNRILTYRFNVLVRAKAGDTGAKPAC